MVAVTRERLGAWLLRCNPNLTDVAGRFADPVRSWCVADNYRSRLMQPPDVVLLWISGQDRHFVRGIWGRGQVTERAERTATGLRIGLELALRGEPMVTDAELRAVGVDALEVQRMPQGSNPSWVSREQLARLASLFPPEKARETPKKRRSSRSSSSTRGGSPAAGGRVTVLGNKDSAR